MTAQTDPEVRACAPELVITRTFSAPRALVFAAWTEPEHLVHWSAPRGFTIIHAEGDLRPGGAWRACMRSPEGMDLWLGGEYRDVIVPERLVFSHAWDDGDGRRGPETLVTVLLEEAGHGTRMTFRQEFFATAESRDGHAGGWTECFDLLADYLAAAD